MSAATQEPALAPAPAGGPPAARPAIPWAAGLFFAVALAFHLGTAAVGWDHRVVQDDYSSFRQTQTGLNTYWMLGHRYRLDYETPVFGPPWSMPYELPVYEWVTAAVSTLTGCPLDPAGRLVAQGFFLLCLWPCWVTLGVLKVDPGRRLVALALLLVSPFYLFWSRTFLIESTALFFALAYLASAWSFLDRPRAWVFALALVTGALAAQVKITTCAGAWLALGLLLPGFLWREGRLRRGLGWLALVGIPIAAGLAWTAYADSLKEQNPLARYLTSRALQEWNFGRWDWRWEKIVWDRILFRSSALAWQIGFLAASAVLALLLTRRWLVVLGCAVIFLTLPFVFLGLYYYHEYYAYASMVFQVGAVALTVVGLWERGGWRRWLGWLGAAAFTAVGVYNYADGYYPIQASNHVESAAVCEAVQEHTRPDEVIVVLGCDWCSEVPYYSRRRALMIPSWFPRPQEVLPGHLERLRGHRLGGLVVRRWALSGTDVEEVLAALRDWGVSAEEIHRDDAYVFYTLRPLPDGWLGW